MNRRSVLRTAAGLLVGGPALALSRPAGAAVAADPTDGWRQTSFTYSWQKPWNLDLSVAKKFQFTERVGMMFLAQFANVLNKLQLNDPSMNIDSPNNWGVMASAFGRELTRNLAQGQGYGVRAYWAPINAEYFAIRVR